MRLSEFIRHNRTSIISEWQDFAHTLGPAKHLSELELTDHINDILTFIASDIETAQTLAERFEKSHGNQPPRTDGVETAAQTHAALRHKDGFDIVEMISEYRALRASIFKLWRRANPTFTAADVDDVERFNEAIDQAVAESVLRFTQSVEKARDLLLGVLGHDIRSPVGAIHMAADLMPRLGTISEKQQGLVEQIKLSAVRVQHIVADLLDLAKSTAGQSIALKHSPCSISDICTRIVAETRIQHPARAFIIDVPGGLDGYWDEVRLGQAVANLVNNAVQYGDKHQPISLHLKEDGDDVVLKVHNFGAAIPKTHLGTIFQSFARLGNDAAVGNRPTNIGLGLFISKEIALAHGGSIGVTSSEADGTEFSIRLPRHASSARDV